MKIITAAQMQALDRRTIVEGRVPGLTLMNRAGTGVMSAMAQAFGPLTAKRVAVVCGKGNNGGDGFVVARLLHQARAKVSVIPLTEPSAFSADAKTMYRRLAGVAKRVIHQSPAADRLPALLSGQDILVDAIFGTGLSSPVEGIYRRAIEAINATTAMENCPVVAVDLPSGLHADTGAVQGAAVRAALTVTFGLPKLGLYVGSGIDHAGLVRIVDIGIPSAYADAIDAPVFLLTPDHVTRLLPGRSVASHKGTFGHAGIIAGSPGKTGAAAMTAMAALRSGAGLVTVATPAGVNGILEGKLLEAMTMPMPDTEAHTFALAALEPLHGFANARQAVAIGPGMTTHPETVNLFQALLPRLEVPSVVDADGLNALAGQLHLLSRCKVAPILTPHPGEMARLVEVDTRSVNADRIGIARRFAQTHHSVLVLKGARTVVARPDGTAAICPTGNPGMATAGTGDALTGVIVGLLAQRLSEWDAACAAVYLHGLAGDLAAAAIGPVGMTAGDLIQQIPHAVRSLAPPLPR